ncbi:MAG: ROK family protein [Bacteroidales bacterium]|nr:ROK family protein [Bacteroidales bacterium]
MDTRTILLDVGGTFIKRPGLPPVPIASAGSREEIAGSLQKALGTHAGRIGVAIPGPFDYQNGVFLMKHKFGAVYGESFAALCGIPEGVEVRYRHDVNAVLEGVLRMMDPEGNTALVSIGTGLGFACAVDGKVLYAPTGSPAVSIWSKPYGNGILEDIVSARGIRNLYASMGGSENLSAAGIAKRAYDGEELAYKAFCRMGEALAQALEELTEQYRFRTILFAGGVSRALVLMEQALRDRLGDIRIAMAPEGAVFRGLEALFENI